MSKRSRDEYKAAGEKILSVYGLLLRKYPKAFLPSGSDGTQPLAIGVSGQILRDNPDVEFWLIRAAVKRYVGKNRYQRAIVTCSHRINLDGSMATEVTQSQRDFALAELRRRQELGGKKAA